MQSNRSKSKSNRDTEKVTVYEVAEKAGVSIATVSRVVNGSDRVAEETADRVHRAIEEMRYQPDRTARNLAEAGRHVLAVATPSFITPFHNELLKGIRRGLRTFECDLLLRDLGSEDSSRELVHFLQHGAADGLIVIGSDLSAAAEEQLRTWRAPVVVVGAQIDGVSSFFWDDVAGGRLATQHLIEAGHRRIGVIQSPRTDLAFQERRLEGHRAALRAAGLAYDPTLTASGHAEKHAGFSEEAGHEGMLQLLSVTPPVTAVFALSDVHAMGAWAALREEGRDVPGDVALVGYDDIKTSQFIGLTSVSQDMHRVGERATEHLLACLEEEDAPSPPLSVKVEPTLRLRHSSGDPA